MRARLEIKKQRKDEGTQYSGVGVKRRCINKEDEPPLKLIALHSNTLTPLLQTIKSVINR